MIRFGWVLSNAGYLMLIETWMVYIICMVKSNNGEIIATQIGLGETKKKTFFHNRGVFRTFSQMSTMEFFYENN